MWYIFPCFRPDETTNGWNSSLAKLCSLQSSDLSHNNTCTRYLTINKIDCETTCHGSVVHKKPFLEVFILLLIQRLTDWWIWIMWNQMTNATYCKVRSINFQTNCSVTTGRLVNINSITSIYNSYISCPTPSGVICLLETKEMNK